MTSEKNNTEQISDTSQELVKIIQQEVHQQLVQKQLNSTISDSNDISLLLPLMDKLDKEHIHKVLENQKIETEAKIKLYNKREDHQLVYTILTGIGGFSILGLIILAFYLLQNRPDIINQLTALLTHGIALLIGSIGGYSYSRSQKK